MGHDLTEMSGNQIWYRHDDAPKDRCGIVSPDTLKLKAGCTLKAGYGTDHFGYGRCSKHLGNAPHMKSKEANLQIMAMYGVEKNVDPAEALLEEVRRTAGHVEWLGRIIQQMEDVSELSQFSAVVFDKDDNPIRLSEKPSFWLELYRAERQHLMKVSKLAVDAGIAERQVRVQEQQARLFAGVIQAILGDPQLGLTPDQRAISASVAKKHLQSLPREIGHYSSGNQGHLEDIYEVVDASS